MKKDLQSSRSKEDILDFVIKEFMSKGFKSTTMDSIASGLQMSKRTLYEIFSTKDEMISEAMKQFHTKIGQKHKETFEASCNVMEGIFKCFLINRDLIRDVNVNFFRDLDYISRKNCASATTQKKFYEGFTNILQKGKDQGYFRKDVNLPVHCRMISIQMESLKRMEELFPKDISILEVYDSISIGFLRAICSPKGIETLDRILEKTDIG